MIDVEWHDYRSVKPKYPNQIIGLVHGDLQFVPEDAFGADSFRIGISKYQDVMELMDDIEDKDVYWCAGEHIMAHVNIPLRKQ